MVEFDVNHALFLTYAGVGAAFLVLGTLVVFTAVIGRWGDWRLRRAQARAEEAQTVDASPQVEIAGETVPGGMNPELAAAIGSALAMAMEAYRNEQADDLPKNGGESRTDDNGWREQGRMVAFDSHRIRERER